VKDSEFKSQYCPNKEKNTFYPRLVECENVEATTELTVCGKSTVLSASLQL
jgi:hypothetical protein